MTTLDRILGAFLAAAALVFIVWASNARMAAHASPDALLRLAWSARPERIEDCRERSEEELARLPQHMRQPIVCEGATAEYRLQVRVDGTLAVDRVLHGGGLRRDRRLYVLEEVAVPAGDATVDISFDRIDTGTPSVGVDGSRRQSTLAQGQAPLPQNGATVPVHLLLRRRLRFSSREVILVTYDSDRRELIVRQR
jgi:hypothetical protein